MFPERFSDLPEYAFPRLRSLLDAHPPGGGELHMTVGEPRHAFPPWLADAIGEQGAGFGRYPVNEGTPELLAAICAWVKRRCGATLDPDRNVMALNGSREGLYNAMAALCPESAPGGGPPCILVPNPCYPVYVAAALSVGAQPVHVPATRQTGHLPDFSALPAETLDRAAAAYVCSPSNPQGAVADRDFWVRLIALAERHDFRILADECYSEIYRGDPPVCALEAAAGLDMDPERLVVFQSLSKRSNVPGLRSGFAAGGPESIRRMRQLRSYGGSPLPAPLQHAAARLWLDEEHVERSRRLYREKYETADSVMSGFEGYESPQAGIFLWLPVGDGEEAALKLWREAGIRVLPGGYLGAGEGAQNPGRGYARVAMVMDREDLEGGLSRIRECIGR